jgi:hypothetical protein
MKKYVVLRNSYAIGRSGQPLLQYVRSYHDSISSAKNKAKKLSNNDSAGYYIYDLENQEVVQAFYGKHTIDGTPA